MEINVPHEIGSEVWFWYQNIYEPVKLTIKSIIIWIDERGTRISHGFDFAESDLSSFGRQSAQSPETPLFDSYDAAISYRDECLRLLS